MVREFAVFQEIRYVISNRRERSFFRRKRSLLAERCRNDEARTTSNKLRSFFESSSTIYLLIDKNLQLIHHNRTAADFIFKHCVFGYKGYFYTRFRRALKQIAKKHKGVLKDVTKLIDQLEANPMMGTDLGQNVYKIRDVAI